MNIYIVGYHGYDCSDHMTLMHDEVYTRDELRSIYAECYREALRSKTDIRNTSSTMHSVFRDVQKAFESRGFVVAEAKAIAECTCDAETDTTPWGCDRDDPWDLETDAMMFGVWKDVWREKP